MKQTTKNLQTYIGICIAFIVCTFNGFSQEYHKLQGNISTNNSNDMIVGNIFLMDKIDSSIIKYSTVEDGLFLIDSIKSGEYILTTSCFGFETKQEVISLHENKNIHIHLDERTINLNEVVITGRKKLFINKDGNIKINIDNSFFSAVPDPINLLSKMPSIQVSPDQESISVIGRGNALIYLGNQKITVNELKSLAIDDIASVEIINNPSSKYEAEGRTVIQITRKIKNQEGYTIDITERASMKKYFNNYSGINLNFLKNKFELKANLEYNQLKVWEKNGFDFNIKDKNIQSDYMTKAITTRPQFKLGVGAYYQINENDYVSIDINGRPLYETYPITTVTYMNDQGHEDNILTSNYSKDDGLYYSGNLNYEKKFTKLDAGLFFGGQYSLFDKDIKSDIYDTYQSLDQTFNNKRKQKYKVNAYSFKLDYDQKFKNDIKWEIGAKMAISDANTKLNVNYMEKPENNSSSDYNYNEYIYAGYTQISGKIPYFSYSAGIRVENTDIRRDNNLSNENYTDLFPKATISIPIDSSKSLSINYSKSITRPNYSSSSQLDVYINPFYVISGNIDLKPCITNEVSATMQIKDLSFGITYYKKKNPIYFNTIYDDTKNLLSLIYSNFQKEEGLNLNITIPFSYKSFSSTNTLSGTYNSVKDESAVTLDTKPYLYYYSNNQITLPQGYVFTVSGWGLTKRKEGIFERNALTIIDLAVSKTFFNKLDCNLMFSDIFNSMKFDEKFILNDIESKGVFYVDSRAITLSLKYTFGKAKASKYKNESIEDNIYRMK